MSSPAPPHRLPAPGSLDDQHQLGTYRYVGWESEAADCDRALARRRVCDLRCSGRDSNAFGGLASAADVPGVRNLDHASSSTYGARTPRVRLITSWPPRTNRGTRKLPTCPLPPIITMRTIPDISYQQTGSAHTPVGRAPPGTRARSRGGCGSGSPTRGRLHNPDAEQHERCAE